MRGIGQRDHARPPRRDPGRRGRALAPAGGPARRAGRSPPPSAPGGDRRPRRGAACGLRRDRLRRAGVGGGHAPPRSAGAPPRPGRARRGRATQAAADGRRGEGAVFAARSPSGRGGPDGGRRLGGCAPRGAPHRGGAGPGTTGRPRGATRSSPTSAPPERWARCAGRSGTRAGRPSSRRRRPPADGRIDLPDGPLSGPSTVICRWARR